MLKFKINKGKICVRLFITERDIKWAKDISLF